MSRIIRPLDRETIRARFRSARPFPFFEVENFLEPSSLEEIVAAYPAYGRARELGREFAAVNEKLKVQITDFALFPAPVQQLALELNGPEFLGDLQYITGIPGLLGDATFGGGGMHLTSASGRLDVHVDFNYLEQQKLFRRLNILIYLNPVWEEPWGGNIELWNDQVSNCEHSFTPKLNRCVVFETNEISYHGVTPVRCPAGIARKSFAAYYYTREAPAGWDGSKHSTVFKARPDEKLRGAVLMPAENLKREVNANIDKAKGILKRMLGR